MSVPWPVAMRAERLVLELRELLVRFDENLKAHTLMQECVPYFLDEACHPQIARARIEQGTMVHHITGDTYETYYASNVHERPFEEQYGIEASKAHLHLHRVAFLREWLEGLSAPPRLLDVAANDGWMAVNLAGLYSHYAGTDLNPANIERADAKRIARTTFYQGRAEEVGDLRWGHDGSLYHIDRVPSGVYEGFDAVIAFELVEHVRDPDRLLAAMVSACRPGGSLFISTPWGACEQGDLPIWWHVEPKGHVRVYTPESLSALISRHGAVLDDLQVSEQGRARLMVCRATVPIVEGDGAQPVRADRARGEGDPGPPGRPRAAER